MASARRCLKGGSAMSAMKDRAALAGLVAEGGESWPAPAGSGVAVLGALFVG